MLKYLLNSVLTYRVETVEEVKAIQLELNKIPNGTLTSFSYTTKYIKEKGEVIGEYQVVKAKLVFNDEKEPDSNVLISFNGESSREDCESFD